MWEKAKNVSCIHELAETASTAAGDLARSTSLISRSIASIVSLDSFGKRSLAAGSMSHMW